MKKQLTALTALTLLTTLACQGSETINVKANIGVLTCVGGNPKCDQNQSINAIGDEFTAEIQNTKFENLGTVTAEKTEKIIVPSTVGAKSYYKFTTQDGKIVHLGLEAKPTPRPGTHFYNEGVKLTGTKDFNLVEVFRFNDAQNKWLRNDMIFVEKAKASEPVDIELSPSGATKIVG